MTTQFTFDVFLSHNSKDKPQVRKLAERLRADGLRVWFDEWVIKPGDDIFLQIENGLQNARTLILCMSSAAFGSDWVSLERNTVLFRDPTNRDRRFIPLLLADCEIPDTLRRYKYVDYRTDVDHAIEELLTACRPETEAPTPHAEPAQKKKPPREEKPEAPQPIAVLEQRLTGHKNRVRSVAISPDGKWMVSGSGGAASEGDNTVRIWDLETGVCRATLDGHTQRVDSVAITPDGKWILSSSMDETVRVWDAQSERLIKEIPQSLFSLIALPGSLTALCGVSGSLLGLLNLESGEFLRTFSGHTDVVKSIASTGDGKRAVSGSFDTTLKYWNLDSGQCLATLTGHSSLVRSVEITPDGRYAVSGSDDKTVKIWDLEKGICVGTLEGHQSDVDSVAISPDGTLIASTGFMDKTVRFWDFKSGACVQVIENEDRSEPGSVAFSPDRQRLVVGTYQGIIYVYQLSGVRTIPPAEPTHRYVNAKVVLVGESGVGKSGLAHRLIEDKFVETHSTHGMQVWQFPLPNPLLKGEGVEVEREALLWDLAGQEDYRLIHQLYLEETALALVLFNPQKDDPFAEIGDWLKALRAAVAAKDKTRAVAKVLIAARVDVGNVKVSQQKIDAFRAANDFAGYLATSALRGDNCSDSQNGSNPSALKQLIAAHIPWENLPWTSTPRLLREIKDAVLEMKQQKGVRLLRFAELCQRLKQTLTREKFNDADVRTAVTLLANHGLVMPLKFGDLVLLQPEILNGYASAVIRAARDHVDEIGCVREQDVFNRAINFSGVDRLDDADEQLLLRAMVEMLLDKSLCIAEDTPEGRHLVFPSQYRRDRPIPEHPEIFVSYTFTGELQTVYTTLVVRLWYSREFQHNQLWRNAAELKTSRGHMTGLLMEKTGEGEGTLSVFFDPAVPDELKVIFIEYVHQHLHKFARDVRRDRRYVCPKCGEPVRDLSAVRKRLDAKKDFITCQNCDKRLPLIDHIEERLKTDPVARAVLGMDEKATQELDAQALEQILIGHMMAISGEANQIYRPVTMFDYGIDGEVEFKDNNGGASGKKIYVQLKSGGSYLRTRRADGKEIFDVKHPRHLEYWVSQPVDVYLVIRDAEQAIRWMNVTRYLKERKDKTSRQIVFDGEKLDAPAVWKVRDNYIPQTGKSG